MAIKPKLNLVGRVFGRLTVLREGRRRYYGRTKKSAERMWVCLCMCGVEKEIALNYQATGDRIRAGMLPETALSMPPGHAQIRRLTSIQDREIETECDIADGADHDD
jgi:hypothetical protein